MLFTLLPTDVLCVIEYFLSRIEHRITFKNVVTQIHIPRNPVLRIATYKDRKCLPYLGKLSLYNTISPELVDILYEKCEYGWGPDLSYVIHIHGLI